MKRLVYLFNCFVFIMILQSCDNEIVNDGESMQQENIEALTKSVAVVCVDLFVQWDGEFLFLGSSCSGGGSSGGGHGSITDGYNDRDIIESPSYPSDWSGGSGGSTHYNPSTGRQEHVYDLLTHIYDFGSTLDLDEKAKLNSLMNYFLSSSSKNKELFDFMEAQKVKIKFHHDPNCKTAANYDPSTKSINIKDFGSLKIYELQEEIVHSVQHQCFYGNSMNTDYKNFEFEAKVYFDLYTALNGISEPFIGTFNASHEFASKYTNWILNIAQNKNGRFTDTNGFNSLCESWTAYSGETLKGFEPLLILRFFRKPVPPQPFRLMNLSINHQ